MKYILNIIIAIDQLVNTILNGDPDETLSARAYRTEKDRKIFGIIFRPIIDMLAILFLDFDHCKKSYESEIKRKQLHKHYSNKYSIQ